MSTGIPVRYDRQIPRLFTLVESHLVGGGLLHPFDAIGWGLETPLAAHVHLRHPEYGTEYYVRFADAETAREILSERGELSLIRPDTEAAWPAYLLDDIAGYMSVS